MLLAGETDAAAWAWQPLAAAASRPGFRVMEGCFLQIQQAMALPNGCPAGHTLLQAVIEEMKASGFVASALARSCQADAIEARLQ
jgi:polar amino acid transport system substrate-binding protein